jgi:hypothetical protein
MLEDGSAHEKPGRVAWGGLNGLTGQIKRFVNPSVFVRRNGAAEQILARRLLSHQGEAIREVASSAARSIFPIISRPASRPRGPSTHVSIPTIADAPAPATTAPSSTAEPRTGGAVKKYWGQSTAT